MANDMANDIMIGQRLYKLSSVYDNYDKLENNYWKRPALLKDSTISLSSLVLYTETPWLY